MSLQSLRLEEDQESTIGGFPPKSAPAFPTRLSSETGPRYRYQSLLSDSHIRLLHFNGSTGYEIDQFGFENLPPYETVSYAWGNPSKEWSIPVDGYVFPITESIAVALRRLVALSRTGYLWIDQISIDQNNPLERGHQVKLMGRIYKQSCRTLVWLDCIMGNFRKENVFRSFLDDCERLSAVFSNHDYTRKRNEYEQTIRSRLQVAEMRQTVEYLFNQSWFSRAWVFQEAVLSQEVVMIVDGFEISLPRLWDFAQELRGLRVEAPGIEFLETVLQKKEDLKKAINEAREDFYWFLKRMAGCETSEPRDHVYAFIGLHTDSRITIEPDYTLSVAEVFTSTARTLMKSTHSLDMLGILDLSAGNPLYLPSWVPDWSRKYRSIPLYKSHDQNLFKASKGYEHNTVDPYFSSLIVNGRIIDEIRLVVVETEKRLSLGMAAQGAPPLSSTLPVDECLSILQSAGISFHSGDARQEILRTYLADGANAGLRMFNNCEMPGSISSFTETYGSHGTTSTSTKPNSTSQLKGLSSDLLQKLMQAYDEPKSQPRDVFNALSRFSEVRLNKNVVYCAQQRLALAPKAARKGDKIAILHGSRVPMVLREHGGGEYSVLGQCYYEGAMFGEAVTWAEDEADEITLV